MSRHIKTSLSLAARALPRVSGVYAIRSKVTGDQYIGSSVNVRARVMCLVAHAQNLRYGMFTNRLARCVREQGADAFTVLVIEQCVPKQLGPREQHYIDTFNPTLNRMKLARRSKKCAAELVSDLAAPPPPAPHGAAELHDSGCASLNFAAVSLAAAHPSPAAPPTAAGVFEPPASRGIGGTGHHTMSTQPDGARPAPRLNTLHPMRPSRGSTSTLRGDQSMNHPKSEPGRLEQIRIAMSQANARDQATSLRKLAVSTGIYSGKSEGLLDEHQRWLDQHRRREEELFIRGEEEMRQDLSRPDRFEQE